MNYNVVEAGIPTNFFQFLHFDLYEFLNSRTVYKMSGVEHTLYYNNICEKVKLK